MSALHKIDPLSVWKNKMNRYFAAGFAMVLSASVMGCQGTKETPVTTQTSTPSGDSHTDHSGWWCVEHGVPEEECALCEPSLVAAFQAKGDWCKIHQRPESQCFQCDPTRFERFAARYEAKFGEKPPQPTE